MTTVPETLAQLERQCLGLRVPYSDDPCWGCSDDHVAQFEITGPGGGVWRVAIDIDGCELFQGPAMRPFWIVRISVEDWLELWAGRVLPATLVESGRLITPRGDDDESDDPTLASREAAELHRLGVLGPLPESGYAAQTFTSENAPCINLWEAHLPCADPDTCPFPSHWEWRPPDLGSIAQLSWILCLLVAIPLVVIGTLLGGSVVLGLGGGLGLALLGGAAMGAGLRARMGRGPRFFRFLVERRMVEPSRPSNW